MFKRKGRIYYKDSVTNRERTLHSFELHSKTKNSFHNLHFQKKDFWIEIDNQDNKPLDFDSIIFSQKEKYIVANLIKNKEYRITAGNKNLTKPSYDLVNFMNEIDYNLPLIKVSEEVIKIPIVTKKNKIAFYETKWFMWLSIAIVALLLLFFTLSLLKNTENID